MKVLVTGVCGQLGYDCVEKLISLGHDSIGTDIQTVYTGITNINIASKMTYYQMNIADKLEVKNIIEFLRPDAVIHCAAWTAVDAAEDENNREKVHTINADGPKYIAEAVNTIGAKMIFLSTDYVFDGKGVRPWQPDDKCYKPLNVYGQSKLDGELAVSNILEKFFIVRTSWAFGKNGNNFVKTMINIGKKHERVRVVNDQIGTPTYTRDLARLLVDMIETDKYGYYHATNEGGYVSWYDFCVEFYRQYGLDTEVIPVSTAEYGLSKAVRPLNSRLDKSKLREKGFTPLPDWRDAVSRYLREAKLV